MLSLVSLSEMETILAKERHYARKDDLLRDASHYIDTLDPRLDEALSIYAKEGRYTDFRDGNMSIITISSLRHCGFLEAAIMMDAYLKDPSAGLDLILRR